MGEDINAILNVEIILLILPTALLVLSTIVVGIITLVCKSKDKKANLNKIENSVDQ